jgi:hypothetical protein
MPKRTPPPPVYALPKGEWYRRTWVQVSLFVLLIAGGSLFTWWMDRHNGNPDNAKVGDCMTWTSGKPAAAQVVSCGNANADRVVLARVNNQPDPTTEAEARKLCAAWPTTLNVFWYGSNKHNGFVLCLAPY